MLFSSFHTQHWQNFLKISQHFFEHFSLPKIEKNNLKESLQIASAVYSANIEGNSLDLNSFSNAKFFGKNFPQKKEEQEIEDLIMAYQFAEKNPLTQKNLLECHRIALKNLLPSSQAGNFRDQQVGVFGQEGLVYMAVEAKNVLEETQKLFTEIEILAQKQTEKFLPAEIFFFASFVHLRFVHIHPFMDGNGRIARILEKWILTEFLGENAWSLQTELVYKTHREKYYSAINLGVNFYELDYQKGFPFVIMLPEFL